MKELTDIKISALERQKESLDGVHNRQYAPIAGNGTSNRLFLNKVVIITGASSGIGRAMAVYFSSAGARVVLAARSTAKLKTVAGEIKKNGGESLIVPTDVTKHHDCYHLIDKTLAVYGTIDILINNAGISMRASFLKVDIKVLERLMDTNFWGSVYCTKYALPHLLESKGSLVAISSICGITPLPGRTGYAASKHALDGFMDTIRVEHLHDDFHVLTVHPGFTTSNIRNIALDYRGVEQQESPRDEGKMMSAEAVANEVGEAIKSRQRDIILTLDGKLITWLYKGVPGLADRLLYNEMAKEDNSPF
jgi:short-subunit dehydrogenase